MKKFITILLALAMILAMSIPAFADNEAETATVTIAKTDDIDRTYEAFKLLDLKVSHKDTGAGHDYSCPVDPETGAVYHVSECFNYNYNIANAAYLAILQEEVMEHTATPFWTALGVPAPENKEAITEDQILKYLETLQGDDGSNYSTLRKTADRIYRQIQANGTLTGVVMTANVAKDLEQGYWMIVETTAGLDEYAAKSVVMLATNAQDNITIQPKSALPQMEKKVKDIDDSEHITTLDQPWQDSADHDIGDTIPFKLTATLPANMDSFNPYKLIFHDTMDEGLQLIPGSFKVYLYSNKVVADADNNMDNSVTLTTPLFVAPTTGGPDIYVENDLYKIELNTADGCDFEFTIKDAKKLPGVAVGNAIVITYQAKLTGNVILGETGNANSAYMEFSNDPYDVTATGKTLEDTVKVFTYGLTIDKQDDQGHPLNLAGFTLQKFSSEADDYVNVGEELKGTDLAPMTTFQWIGLDDGDYRLIESTVPDGYNEMAPIDFTILPVHSATASDPELTAINCVVMGNGDLATGMISRAVVNHTGTALPETGAEGTFLLITGGTMLVILASVFMITRKKMSIYED